jgi:D-3-phosphoglycerate dehydrogenase
MRLLLTHTPTMRANYYGAAALDRLRALGIGIVLHAGDDPLAADALVAAARDCDIILSDRATAGPAEIFAALPTLRAFVRCAVDIRTVDVAAASATGVLVTRASPGFVDAVSELAVGLLVDLARGVSTAAAAYQSGRVPAARMGRQLAGSTLGVIGYGAIGRRVADLGLALGMQVLVADPYVQPTDPRLSHVPLAALLARSDHVVCLAVATEATENLIDAAALAAMKPSAVFINLARGNLVDEAALEAALRAGRLAGAAMDVGRAPDQMPTPSLARLPNVVATPHIGGLTRQAIEAQAFETVEQVAAIVRGEVPRGAVNAPAWSRRPGDPASAAP